jgi:hypothetical protein
VVGTPVTVVKRLPPVEERISPPPPLPQRNAVWGRSASLTNPMR